MGNPCGHSRLHARRSTNRLAAEPIPHTCNGGVLQGTAHDKAARCKWASHSAPQGKHRRNGHPLHRSTSMERPPRRTLSVDEVAPKLAEDNYWDQSPREAAPNLCQHRRCLSDLAQFRPNIGLVKIALALNSTARATASPCLPIGDLHLRTKDAVNMRSRTSLEHWILDTASPYHRPYGRKIRNSHIWPQSRMPSAQLLMASDYGRQ